MSAPRSPVRRRSAAGLLAMLSCIAVLTLSACDTSSGSAPSGGAEHGGGHAEHSGTQHPSTHHTAPSSRPSEYNPSNCPTGLVC
ncbi:hypothetical protein [Actinomycetospora aeridis]|uniref:Lipoprotein n=1 Tax=Actinomycetospora aeridis TaxID=3129231 RepID=A0ABU8N2J9_9PSEU